MGDVSQIFHGGGGGAQMELPNMLPNCLTSGVEPLAISISSTSASSSNSCSFELSAPDDLVSVVETGFLLRYRLSQGLSFDHIVGNLM